MTSFIFGYKLTLQVTGDQRFCQSHGSSESHPAQSELLFLTFSLSRTGEWRTSPQPSEQGFALALKYIKCQCQGHRPWGADSIIDVPQPRRPCPSCPPSFLLSKVAPGEREPGLVIKHHADHTLSSFCQWQSGLMGKDGGRHDHAILLTGVDICSWKNEPCDTLGFAPINGMCSKYRSCTVNEDTGLGLAFTIAHESGHNFGMVHDGEGNICKKSEGNIMSPTLAGHNGVFSWSACSRQYLYKFLSSAQSLCLADQPKPVHEYKYPEKLPGELYDASTQCKWQFGEKAKLCMMDFKKVFIYYIYTQPFSHCGAQGGFLWFPSGLPSKLRPVLDLLSFNMVDA
ncbi:A disintegrin and metalloproteinase with thrombospondin motifs 16 [Varanus komodoensis]|nr:A disintegrin and metalloproteinase with thrombospondin motifs 16 [Varanus komodoensis]